MPPTARCGKEEKRGGTHDFIDRAGGSDTARRKSEDTRVASCSEQQSLSRRGRDQLRRQFSREPRIERGLTQTPPGFAYPPNRKIVGAWRTISTRGKF